MKKKNLKSLSLNKKSISKLDAPKGGLQPHHTDDTMTCILWSCGTCTLATNNTCRNYCTADK